MEKDNELISMVSFVVEAKKEALELFEKFLPYVNDEQDRICDLMEVDTQRTNAKQCALITIAEKMKTAIKFRGCEDFNNHWSKLLAIKIELEKI